MMKTIPDNSSSDCIVAATAEEHARAVDLCSDLKATVTELRQLLHKSTGNGWSQPFDRYSDTLLDWVEEVEFVLLNGI